MISISSILPWANTDHIKCHMYLPMPPSSAASGPQTCGTRQRLLRPADTPTHTTARKSMKT
jgi:hypothetical protein